MSQKIIPIKTIPFAGGVDLAHEAAALPNGALSQDQNFRPRRPGKESRLGQAKHHTTTADGTKDIVSLYGFSKSEKTERHLFAQYDDGSVEEATDNPPTVTTGDYGTSRLGARHSDWAASTAYLVGDVIFSTNSKLLKFKCTVAGTSDSSEPTWPVLGATVADNTVTWQSIQGVWPASWAKFRDLLIYADGAGIGQIYTGQDMKPVLFNVYKGTTSIPLIPEEGADYTQEVVDGLASTYADASSLADINSDHCMFVMLDTPINKMNFELSAYNSGSAAVWNESGSNPVVDHGSSGWNSRHSRYPTVIKDGSTYKMWMSGYDGSFNKIGYYTSSDGITWSLDTANVLTGNYYAPTVIKDDSTYKMWVTNTDSFENIHYYTSSDGITWTPYGSNPVLSVASTHIAAPTVIKDDSTYKMWVSRGNDAIDYYTSSDGISWTPDVENPVITVGESGTWNDVGVGAACAYLDGTTMKLWVTGHDGDDFTIGLYTLGASSAVIKYWNGSALTSVTNLADGTKNEIYLDQDGSLTWDSPADEVPTYAFGRSGFLYQWSHDDSETTLDSSVNITKVTGEYTDGFQDIQNVWDGLTPGAIEALFYDPTAGTYATYSSQAILVGDLVATTGYIYISSLSRLFGLYLDVKGTPNTGPSTTIGEVATWTGEAFTALSGLNDGTVGGVRSGHVTWQRNTDIRKVNFNSSQYHAYWYRIKFGQTLSSSLVWAIDTLPYFDINEIWPTMQAVCAWDNRLWYSFNDNMLYGTDLNKPMSLNGDNLVLVEAAKHSKNKAICMRRFYQFMLVWGEEKGEEGGYFTIVQPGATASGYDSQVISERIGIMNNKCAVTLEDSNMGDLNTERPVMKGVYFLSRSGVYKSDGSFLKNISGAIGNYFDPTRAECIRRGYEKEHFLSWDSTYGVIRLGLVSGGSATVPNKHFIFDTTSDTWHEDLLGQPLSSISEVDGASGDIPVLQYGGGQDGYVYRLNTTDDDVSTAIDKSLKIELDGEGYLLHLKAMAFVFKSQVAGDIIVDVYRNGESASAYTYTISMIKANVDYKGKRFNCDVRGDHLTIRLRNNVAGQPVYLLEHGFDIERIENNAAYD